MRAPRAGPKKTLGPPKMVMRTGLADMVQWTMLGEAMRS